ncbi:MAG: type II secretion system protein GspE, partial [Oscillospiraceae bacterium]|nr:type II secretion system protein GspE [Oscillospiraceae bacterium]
MKNVPIGEVLKEYGYITDDHIKQALDYQKTEAGQGKRLGALLQELGFVTELQVLESLGRKLELPMINFDDYIIDLEASEKLPKQLAVKYNVLPLSQNDNRFQIAMSDPLNFYAQEDIRQIVGMPLEIYLAESATIKRLIDQNYAEVGAKLAAKQANTSVEDLEVPTLELEDGEDEVPVIKLVNSLLVRGYSTNASDIHIEPFEKHTQVRMRIDG